MASSARGCTSKLKRTVRKLNPDTVALKFPIAGLVEGWFFRVDEMSAGSYCVEGTDLWGRRVSNSGVDGDALLKQCAEDARAIQASLVRPGEGPPQMTPDIDS
jgi:hypothetical protein